MASSSVWESMNTLLFVVCCFFTQKALQVKGQTLPTLDSCLSPFVVPEDAAIGQKLFSLQARVNVGAFPANNLTFTLESASTGELVNLTQTVYLKDSNPPWQWSSDVLLRTTLDRDFEPSKRTLSFGATDTNGNKATLICNLNILDVNDNAPSFQGLPYDIQVSEMTAVGAVLRTGISASDPDTGIGGLVLLSSQFSDTSVEQTFNTTTYVQGGGQAMDILLAQPLDYETRTFYTFNIKAQDGGSLNTTAMVRVTVTDAQDTPPVFLMDTYRAAIREHQPLGTPVITVSAVDGDRDPPNAIVYSIVQGRSDFFAINSSTGSITSLTELDRDNATLMDTDGVFRLTVRATETNGVKPQYGNTTREAEVVVVVEDINDHPPTFSSASPYTAFVRADSPVGALIYFDGNGYISVSDADQGRNSHFNLTVERYGVPWAVLAATPGEVYSEGLVLLRIMQKTDVFKELAGTHISLQLVAREISTQERRSSTAAVIITVERPPEPPTTPPPATDDSITAPDIVVFVIGFLVIFNVVATILIVCYVRRNRKSEEAPPRQGLARKGSKYYINGMEKDSRRSSGFQNGSAVSLRSESVLVEVDCKDRCDVVSLSAVVAETRVPESSSMNEIRPANDDMDDGHATDRKVLLGNEVSPAKTPGAGTSRSLPEAGPSAASSPPDDMPDFSKARRHVSAPRNPALGLSVPNLNSSSTTPTSRMTSTVPPVTAASVTSATSSTSSVAESVSVEPVTRFSAKGPVSMTAVSAVTGSSQPTSALSSVSSATSGRNGTAARVVSTSTGEKESMGEILY
ncbi:hypothetical protein ACOMHN_007191 [Nucella lapillus]